MRPRLYFGHTLSMVTRNGRVWPLVSKKETAARESSVQSRSRNNFRDPLNKKNTFALQKRARFRIKVARRSHWALNPAFTCTQCHCYLHCVCVTCNASRWLTRLFCASYFYCLDDQIMAVAWVLGETHSPKVAASWRLNGIWSSVRAACRIKLQLKLDLPSSGLLLTLHFSSCSLLFLSFSSLLTNGLYVIVFYLIS